MLLWQSRRLLISSKDSWDKKSISKPVAVECRRSKAPKYTGLKMAPCVPRTRNDGASVPGPWESSPASA